MYIKFCIKIIGLNGSYSANTQFQSENDNILEEPKKLRFALLIRPHPGRDQNSHQCQCSILVT